MTGLCLLLLALGSMPQGFPDAPSTLRVDRLAMDVPGAGPGALPMLGSAGGSPLTFQLLASNDIGAAACQAMNTAGGINTAHKAQGSATPLLETRSTGAYARVYDGSAITLQWVPAEVMRCERWLDKNSAVRTGYLAEIQATNLVLQSQTLSTTWAQLDAGDSIGDDASAAPDGTTTADSLIADSTDGPHGLTQGVNLTNAVHVLSVYAKAGNQDWLYLSDDTVANADGYFNLAACGAGTSGAGATSHVIDYGGGWCRCAIAFTGTAAAHTLRLASAEADGDHDFAGTGPVANTSLWGVQAELLNYPTSYVPTVAAQVTRTKDQLQYEGNDNLGGADNGQGTIVATVLCRDYNLSANGASPIPVDINAGGSANDRIVLYFYHAGDHVRAYGRAGGVVQYNIIGTAGLYDGAVHEIRHTYVANAAHMYVDGIAEGTPDTSCTIPTGLSQLDVGMSNTAAGQLGCLLVNLKIYSKAVAP